MPDDKNNAEEHGEPDHRKATNRKPRRATAPGTGPTTANGPEPRLESMQPELRSVKTLTERDRWIIEQKPPHY